MPDSDELSTLKIRVAAFTGVPDDGTVEQLRFLHRAIFADGREHEFVETLRGRSGIHGLIACDRDDAVGYKIGYALDAKTYYSWMGGVLSGYRRRGIASDLLRRQHGWCARQGYERIRTRTQNQWRGMLVLNIRCGFDVIATEIDERGEHKIIMEKTLRRPGPD